VDFWVDEWVNADNHDLGENPGGHMHN
jgi:hypothetical protein